MAESPQIISVDYTDLFRHRSRSYTFDSIAVPVGIDWQGVVWGLSAGGFSAIASSMLFSVIGLPWWSGLVVGVAVTVAIYLLVSRDSRGRVSPIERLFLMVDYTFFQPALLHGTGADDTPTHFHWQVILWRPEWMPESTNEFDPPALYGISLKGS